MEKQKISTALRLQQQYLQHKALFKNLVCILLSLLTVFSLAFTPAPLSVDSISVISNQRTLSADASILLLILGVSLFFFINMQFQKV